MALPSVDASISPLKLVLVSMTPPQSEREVLNGTLQVVYTVIKGQPFDVILEWQRSSPSDPLPPLAAQRVTVSLLRTDTNTLLPESRLSIVPWRRKASVQTHLVELDVRLNALSSAFEGTCFRLHISVKDSAGKEYAKPVLSDAIRVISRVTPKHKRMRDQADAPHTAAPPAAAKQTSAPLDPPIADAPSAHAAECKKRTHDDLDQVELRVDYLCRLTAAAHAATAPGAPLLGSASAAAAGARPPPSRLGPLSAPMKASTSELALPSLFGSLSELPTLSASTLDLPLQASSSGALFAASSSALSAPPTPAPTPAPPPPPPPPIAPSDEALNSALAVALAVVGREAPEVRAHKIKRFVKSHATPANPSYVQIASDIANVAAAVDEK